MNRGTTLIACLSVACLCFTMACQAPVEEDGPATVDSAQSGPGSAYQALSARFPNGGVWTGIDASAEGKCGLEVSHVTTDDGEPAVRLFATRLGLPATAFHAATTELTVPLSAPIRRPSFGREYRVGETFITDLVRRGSVLLLKAETYTRDGFQKAEFEFPTATGKLPSVTWKNNHQGFGCGQLALTDYVPNGTYVWSYER